ncbi:hypothetical protein T01_11151 [Trichinella spiralis]|uniref:Uncharacterized protein n=1 Tax=Trichinella spiralis TaxID=6334 RepID=A0A0V1BMW6_TRISP|nr:hypothetical protein T01_11151 [Trichinella spiralis]
MGVYRQSKVRLFPPYLVDRLSNRNLHDVQKIQSVFEIRELKTRGFDYWRIFDGICRFSVSKPIISSELTDVDFVEMTASSDEKKDADEDIATDHAADDVFGADSNMVRVIKFKRDLEITADRKFSIK